MPRPWNYVCTEQIVPVWVSSSSRSLCPCLLSCPGSAPDPYPYQLALCKSHSIVNATTHGSVLVFSQENNANWRRRHFACKKMIKSKTAQIPSIHKLGSGDWQKTKSFQVFRSATTFRAPATCRNKVCPRN